MRVFGKVVAVTAVADAGEGISVTTEAVGPSFAADVLFFHSSALERSWY